MGIGEASATAFEPRHQARLPDRARKVGPAPAPVPHCAPARLRVAPAGPPRRRCSASPCPPAAAGNPRTRPRAAPAAPRGSAARAPRG
jgi:hypothetical protein